MAPSDEGFTSLIHVLHVDDDTSILEVSKQILIDMGNFEIDHACCVDEAFKKLAIGHFDVVISDYEMPQKDGLQFLKELREKNDEIPFILFTGKGREEVAIKALNLGADAYINKQGNPETVYGELSHSIVKTVESKNSKKLLTESESKYFHLFNTSEVGMFRTMLHSSEILDINEKLLQILGYTREEVQGKPSTFCYADAAQRQELIEILEAKGQVADFEIRLVSKQGEIKTCLLSSKLYPEQEMVEGSIIDVTESKKAEQALAESEEKYKNLFENAPDVIVAIDLNGKITSVNKAIVQHGFEENEIVGESIFKLFPIEYNQKMIAGLRNIAIGKPAHGEIEILTPEGRRNTEYNSNPIWKNGKVIGYQMVIRDISERKKAEKALRDSEEKHRKLFEESLDAIFVADVTTGVIIDCNVAASKLVGREKLELIGQNQSIIHPKGQMEGGFTGGFKQHLKDQTETIETQIIMKTGEIRDVAVKGTVFELNGKKLIQGVFRDVTDRNKNDHILKASEEKFRNLAENSPNMIFIYQKGKVVYANKEAEKAMGYTKEEYYSSEFNFLDLVESESRELVVSNFTKHTKGEDTTPYEYGLMTKCGRRIEAILNTKVITYNEEPAILGIVTDITERKHLNLQLVDSEQRYHALFDEAPLGVLVIDPQTGKPAEFNDVAHNQLGYSREEFSKLCVLDFEAKEEPDETRAHLARIVRQGGDEFETKHRAKSGEIRDVLVTARAVELARKTFIYSIFHDITEIIQVQDALMKSEMEYRQLVNLAQEGVWVFDREYCTVFVNPRMANMLGYAESEMVRKNLFDFIPEAEVGQAIQYLAQYKRGVEGTFEYEFPCKDGSKVYTSITASQIKDDEGNPTGTLALVSDITLRKKTENELKQESQKLETITESIGVGLTITSKDYRILWTNKVMKKVRGVSDLEGKTCYATYNYLDAVCPDCGVKKIFEGKEFDSREYMVFDKEKGSTIWMQLIATPIKDKDGNVTSALELVLPITERKMMEQSLKVSEERFRTIMNSALDAIIAVDEAMNIVEWNPAASRIFGYTQEEIIGKSISNLIPFDTTQTATKEIRRFIETNPQESIGRVIEITGLKKDGSEFFAELSFSKMQINGKNHGVAFLRDISERKQVQKKLENYSRVLEETVAKRTAELRA
ncbi:MAG TPA: PAS domain S-box protein, partial [Candidatus Bathyarchaeia archaeon]|nr:PAS domain S-box protein [Candidatus Bathyarchaeia archaeon]